MPIAFQSASEVLAGAAQLPIELGESHLDGLRSGL